ncbi:WGxxGxxG family protein [Paenibacillus sp. FSL K6-3182]|uniref:WGxxGxxG family protein n=1 Tax=Paenibacillus sp. FSL K6-3182 TaxID=2921495 RepID=UPI0030CDF445
MSINLSFTTKYIIVLKSKLERGNQMKKILLIGFISCLMMFNSISVSAESNAITPGQELRYDVNLVTNDTNRALNTDDYQNYRINNYNTPLNANNYRTTATSDNRGSNWGWLGLLGLLGLAGMRSRATDRDRDRA